MQNSYASNACNNVALGILALNIVHCIWDVFFKIKTCLKGSF